jgi:hypothetical protein
LRLAGGGSPISGLLHSPGIENLDFLGPSELDSGVMAVDTVDLLNEPKTGSDFQQ